jgi:hypothetical protein
MDLNLDRSRAARGGKRLFIPLNAFSFAAFVVPLQFRRLATQRSLPVFAGRRLFPSPIQTRTER